MRFTRIIGATAAVAALALTGCGGGDEDQAAAGAGTEQAKADCPADGATLRLTYLKELGPEHSKLMLARFRKAHPDVELEISNSSATYADAIKQVVADEAAGVHTDVVLAGLNQVAFYVDTLGAQPIPAEVFPDGYDDRFRGLGEVDGEIYAVPRQISIPIVIWNKDVFEQAGLDPERPPETTAEVLELSRQIKERVDGVSPAFWATSIVSDWAFQNALQSAGGQMTENGEPAFDSEAGAAALEAWYELNEQDLAAPAAALEGFAMFNEGKIGMALASVSLLGSITQGVGDGFEWGAAPMPVPTGGTPRFAAGGNGWMVLTDDPCRARLAHDFIKTSVTTRTQVESAKATGYIPVSTEAREQLADFYAEHPNFAVPVEYDGELTPWIAFRGPRAFEASEVFKTLLESVAAGTAPEEALSTAADKVRSILGD